MKKIGLNLGCGAHKSISTEEMKWINIDKDPGVKPDLIIDLEEAKLPFESSTIDEIYCSHLLEHIRNFNPLMEETYRVCKPGAKVVIRAPYGLSEAGIADTTHIRLLCFRTFEYFDKSHKILYDIYRYNCNFKIIETENEGGKVELMRLLLKAVK